ncbi:MAG: hypothetical protein JSS79_11545 [Bacteroidetes bacterium]|nr:hypothetical protein [Bacteroidota bacterium]
MKRIFTVAILILVVSCRQRQNEKLIADSVTTDKATTSTVKFHDNSVEVNESDTVLVGNYSLVFQPTDSIEMSDIFEDLALRKQMTDSIGNWHEKIIFLEKYLLGKYPKFFDADKKTLTLFLEDGKELKLPKWDSVNQVGYNFGAYLPSIDYYLIYVPWYEGSGLLLVNRRNGFKKEIIGEPYFLTKSKRILTINSDLYAGYTDNGIELLSISGDTIKSEFKLIVKNWGPTGARWLTENKIVIEKEYFDPKMGKKYSLVTIE